MDNWLILISGSFSYSLFLFNIYKLYWCCFLFGSYSICSVLNKVWIWIKLSSESLALVSLKKSDLTNMCIILCSQTLVLVPNQGLVFFPGTLSLELSLSFSFLIRIYSQLVVTLKKANQLIGVRVFIVDRI